MPVVGVVAQAHVPDHEQVRNGPLHRARRLLHDALLVVRLGARTVLGRRQAEQHDPPEAEPVRALRVFDQLVHGRLVRARQEGDLPSHAAAVAHEQRPHELGGDEVRLLHQAPQRRGATQPAHPADRELGGAHRASNLDAP